MDARLTTAETAAGLTAIGSGIYLAPASAAMSRTHLAAWFRARGVTDLAYLDELLGEHQGRTEAEMDEIYSAMHCG